MMLQPGGVFPPACYYVGLFLLVFGANVASVDGRILEVSIPPLLQTSPPKGELLFVVTHDPARKPQVLELSCKADGLPPPEYSWTKDGHRVDIDGEHAFLRKNSGTLYFPNPKPSDEGEYQCIARNRAGIAYSDVTSVKRAVAVAFPKGEPRVVTVDLGDPLELPCENPGGYPKPSLHWVLQKTDGSLRSVTSPRATVDEEGTLWFSAVTLEDASEDALYACAASSITRDSFVTVNALAGRTEYRMGNWVYLNVSLPPEFDEEEIALPEAIRSAPFLQHVTDGNRTVLKGQDFRLYCIYGGYPEINTRWWTGGTSDLTENLIEFGKALDFTNAVSSHEGTYYCQASNEEGQSDVKTFYVKIEEPPIFVEKPNIVNQPTGESAVFVCRAVGSPDPTYAWSLNGKTIENANLKMLKFDSLRPEDKGVIGCNASNTHGYVYATGFLNVLSLPPEIITPPKDQKEFRGAPVTLTCEAYGAPDPTISWQRISSQKTVPRTIVIRADENYEIGSNSLHIKALTEETTGQYLCLAKNKFTSVVAQAEVSLIKYTRVNLTLSSPYINVSDSATLTCVVEGDSNLSPKVIWLKNEKTMNLSDPKYILSETNMTLEYGMSYSDNDTIQTISTLTVESAEGDDSGVYSCIAKTAVDETEDSQILTVQDVPDRPVLAKVECGALEAFVHWKFGGSEHNNALTGFIIQEQTDLSQERWHKVEEIIPATDQTFKVPLKAGRVYSFRVLAVNEIGTSRPSEPSSKCVTSPQIPKNNPLDVKALTVDSNTIRVVWKVIEPFDHYGPDFRYEVEWALEQGEKEHYIWEKIIIEDWEQSETLLEGLLPHSLYKVKVFSVNEIGIAKDIIPISAYSGAEIPETPPMNLRVRRVTSSSAILAWIPVPESQILGLLKGYQVELQKMFNATNSHSDEKQKLVIDGRASRAVLTNLSSFTTYSARVRVINNRYYGPFSEGITFRTGESASSAVMNLTAKPLSSDSLLVRYDLPLHPNGIISSYEIAFKPLQNEDNIETRLENDESAEKIVVNFDELQVKLPFLKRETQYLIQVFPINDAGLGKDAAVTALTEMFPLAPPIPPLFKLKVIDTKTPETSTPRTMFDRDLDGDIDEQDQKLRRTILTDSNRDGDIDRDDVLDLDGDGDIDELDFNATDINDDGFINKNDIYAGDVDNDGDVDFDDIGDKDEDGDLDINDILVADADGDGQIDAQDDNGRYIILQDTDGDGDIDEDDITEINSDGHIEDRDIKALDIDHDGDIDINDLRLADRDGDGDVDGADISDFNGNGRIDENDFKIKDRDGDGDVDKKDFYLRNIFIKDINGDGEINNEDIIDQDGDSDVDKEDLRLSDIDGDGELDIEDILLGDSDGDGDVDKSDIQDINGDGEINLKDIRESIGNYDMKTQLETYNVGESIITTLDINQDGKLDQSDLTIFDSNKDNKIDRKEFFSANLKMNRDKYSGASRNGKDDFIIPLADFSRLDINNSGDVDESDLKLLDKNKNGYVEADDLKLIFKDDGLSENRINEINNKSGKDTVSSNDPIFLWDADEDGVISKNDVGDVDKDGDIDKDDFRIVDIDKDGDIDDDDLVAGDNDKDGDIDFSDVGDEDGDGDIDFNDLKIADEDGDGDIDSKDDDGESILLMDFNKDGIINNYDITDINHDGIINNQDKDALDLNKDGYVNLLDLRMGDRDGDLDIDAADIYDVDGDGDVDSNDLVASAKNSDGGMGRNDRVKISIVLADTDKDGDINVDDVLDIDGDGNITEADIKIVDINKDGVINKQDVAAADRDGDGDVDRADIGDVNKDGDIDIADVLTADRDRDGDIDAKDSGDSVKFKIDWQPNSEKHSGSAFYVEYRPMGAVIWRQSPVVEGSLRHEMDGFNPRQSYEVRMVAKDGRFETPSKTRRVGPARNVELVKDPTLGAVMDDEVVDPLLWTWFIVSVMTAVTMLCAVFFSVWVYNHRMLRVAELRKQLYEGVETSTDEALSKDDVEAPLNGLQDVEEPLTAAKQRQMAALLRRQDTTQSVDSFASQDDDFSEYGDETMGRFTDEGSLVRLNVDRQ